MVDHRAIALRDILALEATADDDVAAFRTDFLEQGLLDISEVAEWINLAASNEDDPVTWHNVPTNALTKGTSPDDPALNQLQGYSEYTPKLPYVADKARYAHSVLIRLDGVLGHLKVLAQRIADRYDWDLAETVTFVLTGLLPAPRGLRVHTIEPWPWPQARKRVALDIPLNTTPDDVADAFRTMRKELLGAEPVSRRSLTERAANLAVFAAQHSTGYTWNEARRNWNREHRKTRSDQFTDSDKFKRAMRAAYKRITGDELDWAGNQPDETITTT